MLSSIVGFSIKKIKIRFPPKTLQYNLIISHSQRPPFSVYSITCCGITEMVVTAPAQADHS